MVTFFICMYIVVVALLVVVVGARPYRTTMSRFELTRRSEGGDEHAQSLLRRESLLHDIFSLQRVLTAVLLVLISAIGVAAFEWWIGLLASLFVALEIGALARIPALQMQAQKVYQRYEPALLDMVEKLPGLFGVLRSVAPESGDAHHLQSREEMLHLVSQSGDLLSAEEKKLVHHSLTFGNIRVRDVMTPRSMIDSIKKTELLGPLVLHDLHKTGHNRFPVIDGDIDHIIGILYVRNLLTIGNKKKSVTANTAMDAQVFYIHEEQHLKHALPAFIRTHHHLFIVVNEYRETVGLLSLEDVIEALLGNKIVDEFDAHDDLRSVAERNPRGNNHPTKSQDV